MSLEEKPDAIAELAAIHGRQWMSINSCAQVALGQLGVDDAFGDDVFKEARAIGTEFQSALTKLFFGSDPTLTAATQRYGVF